MCSLPLTCFFVYPHLLCAHLSISPHKALGMRHSGLHLDVFRARQDVISIDPGPDQKATKLSLFSFLSVVYISFTDKQIEQ